MKNKIFILLTLTVFLASCAQTVILQTIPAHDNFNTDSEKATIYIYRDEDFGGSLPLSLSINDIEIGKTTGRTFFKIAVLPNTYKLTTSLGKDGPLVLKVEAGKNYFIRQELKVGMIRPSSILEIVDNSLGQSGVKLSNRLESNRKINQ